MQNVVLCKGIEGGEYHGEDCKITEDDRGK